MGINSRFTVTTRRFCCLILSFGVILSGGLTAHGQRPGCRTVQVQRWFIVYRWEGGTWTTGPGSFENYGDAQTRIAGFYTDPRYVDVHPEQRPSTVQVCDDAPPRQEDLVWKQKPSVGGASGGLNAGERRNGGSEFYQPASDAKLDEAMAKVNEAVEAGATPDDLAKETEDLNIEDFVDRKTPKLDLLSEVRNRATKLSDIERKIEQIKLDLDETNRKIASEELQQQEYREGLNTRKPRWGVEFGCPNGHSWNDCGHDDLKRKFLFAEGLAVAKKVLSEELLKDSESNLNSLRATRNSLQVELQHNTEEQTLLIGGSHQKLRTTVETRDGFKVGGSAGTYKGMEE